jgi:hypothetical protein
MKLAGDDLEKQKEGLHLWYAKDKTLSTQKELIQQFNL